MCTQCGAEMNPAHIALRREHGYDSMHCPVCETRIPLVSREAELGPALTSNLSAMDRTADDVRDLQAADSVQRGRAATGDFDIFLSYNRADTSAVREIAQKLKEWGILPWLDKWELPPGSLVPARFGQTTENRKIRRCIRGSSRTRTLANAGA